MGALLVTLRRTQVLGVVLPGNQQNPQGLPVLVIQGFQALLPRRVLGCDTV